MRIAETMIWEIASIDGGFSPAWRGVLLLKEVFGFRREGGLEITKLSEI
jgi:hypothetical protein